MTMNIVSSCDFSLEHSKQDDKLVLSITSSLKLHVRSIAEIIYKKVVAVALSNLLPQYNCDEKKTEGYFFKLNLIFVVICIAFKSEEIKTSYW